jgi:hypothetical protein
MRSSLIELKVFVATEPATDEASPRYHMKHFSYSEHVLVVSLYSAATKCNKKSDFQAAAKANSTIHKVVVHSMNLYTTLSAN